MRVLIVDDSVVFRSQIKTALDGVENITVVGTAANGKIALEKLEQTLVDVVILDLEMPVMDGMQMLSEMKVRSFPQKVIVFAAPTGLGIDHALNALRAGAVDFISKPNTGSTLEDALEGIKKELVPKILQFKSKYLPNSQPNSQTNVEITQKKSDVNLENDIKDILKNINKNTVNNNSNILSSSKPKAIGFGSSTGGPNALEIVFSQLKTVRLNIPIFLTQHMPPKFTEALAKRIQDISGHPTHEAKHKDIVIPGNIYVAPGDYHMTVERALDDVTIQICLDQGPKRNFVRPAVDNLFESLAKVYGKNCNVFVLTGMGEDGLIGSKAIKSALGGVIIQDSDSSVVWGMPGAIHAAGSYDMIGNLNDCANLLVQMAT